MVFFDLHEPEDGQDRFFLYAMIVLPFCSSGSYLFDAWFHYHYHPEQRTYEGLLSTVMIVFSYLQYCAPIRSRKALAVYYILLCLITELASIGYLLYYIQMKEIGRIIFYSCMLVFDLSFTSGLIYCRVYNDYESHIVVENKHLFHFMSRLEVILTIFIPVFMNVRYTSVTRNIIAYFLLFDFFSDSYCRFQGVWIKSALYLFATTTTVSVATEWFYFNDPRRLFEDISLISELFATILCDTIIILQFFPFHFKTQHVQNIALEALRFQRSLYAATTTAETSISMEPTIDTMKDENMKLREEARNDLNTAM